MAEREEVQDPNLQRNGNTPVTNLPLMGIMGGGASGQAPRQDSTFNDAINAVTRLSGAMDRKKRNADFIEGQMASMAGKTQAEVAALGNSTSMAGFVSLEVGNAVSAWAQEEATRATTDHYGTTPEAYREHLSRGAANLISQMGGDDYAEEQLTKALAPTMERLAASQAQSHAAYTQTETINAYTNSLIGAGQYAASDYEYSTDVNGAVTAGGDYRAFAASISGQLIGVESGGNPNAQNPNSTAGGLGQFLDSTWISTLRKYRPDLARGKTEAELLAMKKGNPALNRQMSIEYSAEMARGLAASGMQVNPGNTYLAYFAGLGGARRVLSADPHAPVSSSLTQAQINANRSVVYRDGRLITNAELQAWAHRKMGGQAAGAPQVRQSVLTNPGLPPEQHRAAVVSSIVTTLAADDGSLWQSVGGLEGLADLNLSAAQIAQLNSAHRSFNDRRQNDYNMEYERARHNLLEEASSGEFTEEEMFAKLAEMNGQYGQSDAEMRRIHDEMQKTIDGEALDVWQDPQRQYDLMQLKNDVLDGTMSAEEAMQSAIEIGEMYGADIEATEEAVAIIMGAYDRVRAEERAEVENATMLGQKERETRDRAAALISRNVLGTGTADEQAAGIALLEQTLYEDLQANGTPPEDIPAKASEMMAQALVYNDVVDTRRASIMRASLHNPVGPNGEVTPSAVEALAFYMDLKVTAGAPPEYIARMFKGNERTLEVLTAAEGHLIGDGDLETALQRAWDQTNNPVTAARIQQTNRLIEQGVMQEQVKEEIIRNSGLVDSFWSGVMNTFNSDYANTRLDAEGQKRIMEDTGIDLVIESEVRSAVGMYPNSTPESIAAIVSGQMSDRGAVIGSSFVMAPPETNMREVMGLNSTERDAPNSAVVAYVTEHGEDLFGPAVWNDLQPSFLDKLDTVAAGVLPFGASAEDKLREHGFDRPEFVVELIGDNLVIRPASADYTPDNYSSIPEGAMAVVPATEIGAYWNQRQTKQRASVTGTIADLFRGGPETQRTEEDIQAMEDAAFEARLADALPD